MLKKILVVAGVIIVIRRRRRGGAVLLYPVQVSIFAGLTRNYFLSWSAPPGTTRRN